MTDTKAAARTTKPASDPVFSPPPPPPPKSPIATRAAFHSAAKPVLYRTVLEHALAEAEKDLNIAQVARAQAIAERELIGPTGITEREARAFVALLRVNAFEGLVLALLEALSP